MRPTSGRPVDLRTTDRLAGLQRDSLYAIRDMTGTTFAGKCWANSGSHLGHELAAALAGAGANKAVVSIKAITSFSTFPILLAAPMNARTVHVCTPGCIQSGLWINL